MSAPSTYYKGITPNYLTIHSDWSREYDELVGTITPAHVDGKKRQRLFLLHVDFMSGDGRRVTWVTCFTTVSRSLDAIRSFLREEYGIHIQHEEVAA